MNNRLAIPNNVGRSYTSWELEECLLTTDTQHITNTWFVDKSTLSYVNKLHPWLGIIYRDVFLNFKKCQLRVKPTLVRYVPKVTNRYGQGTLVGMLWNNGIPWKIFPLTVERKL